MAVICPAVLAKDPHEYREQMERITPFARRIQIDLTDGQFAHAKTVTLEHVWWPEGVKADIHLMYKHPTEHIRTVLILKPHLVIVHAEAEGNFMTLAEQLHHHHIKVGVALLPDTNIQHITPAISTIDHVLIFSGDLGHFGGKANLSHVDKAKQLKKIRPDIEIGWDGGVNEQNARILARNGVDVLNVGGFIQNSRVPQEAYAKLEAVIREA